MMTTTETTFPDYPEKQAFCTSAEVVYNVKGANVFPDPSLYNGQFEVLKTWLSRDYLWNTVRQQGGAYGCFIQFNQLTGNMGIISYRDPQVEKTFAAYDNAWVRVEALELPETVLQQLIIGTYGNFDPHQGPAARGATARNEYLSGITLADKQQRVDEILTTNVVDLRAFGRYLKNISESSFIATIGNSVKIKENASLYDDIVEL
jgi:Zn-dependent M16 (insulinase) family peptidase